MELAMTNGFSELSFNEMEMVDGGKWWEKAIGALYIGAAFVAAVDPATCWASGMLLETGVSILA